MKQAIASLIAFSLIGGTALAQSDTDAPERGERTVTYAKETHIDFREINVDGVVVQPGISLVDVNQHKGFTPMITLRTNFDAEMADSVNDVR